MPERRCCASGSVYEPAFTDEVRKTCIVKYRAVASAIANAVELSIAAFDYGEKCAIRRQEIVLLLVKILIIGDVLPHRGSDNRYRCASPGRLPGSPLFTAALDCSALGSQKAAAETAMKRTATEAMAGISGIQTCADH